MFYGACTDSYDSAGTNTVHWRGVHHLADSVRRARVGAAIALSYRERQQTPDDDESAMASVMAMAKAEPW